MPSTMTTYAAALKEIYEGRIQNQLNEEQVCAKRLARSSEGIIDTVGGKYVTFPIRTKRNSGISYRNEGSQIADPGEQGYAAVQVRLRYGYGRFRLTGQVMELAETNPQAFASAQDEEMDRLKDDLSKDSNRIMWGFTTNSILAATVNTTASATQAVTRPSAFSEGMKVDFVTISSGAVKSAALTVNAVDLVNKTITLSASITPVAGDGFVRAGNYGIEPTGLLQILQPSGVLYGVDPAVTPVWKSNVLANGGSAQALSETRMIQAADLARQNGGKSTVIFTSLGVRRAYFNLLVQNRRYTDPKTYSGGFVGLPFNYGTEIPVVEDPDGISNKMLFVDENKLTIHARRDWHFADADNSVLKWDKDYDMWEGMMRKYWELGTSQRNAHTLYDDITEA